MEGAEILLAAVTAVIKCRLRMRGGHRTSRGGQGHQPFH
jgi:hypothetical protein